MLCNVGFSCILFFFCMIYFKEVIDVDYVVKGKIVDKVVKLFFLLFGDEGMV